MAKDVNSVAGPHGGVKTGKSNKEIITKVFQEVMDNPLFMGALGNVSLCSPLDREAQTPPPYKGKPFTPAEMGFIRFGNEIRVALAAKGAIPRYLAPEKFVALVEFAHDRKFSTVVLQNHQTPTDRREGLGQILGRLLPDHSAINIAMGNQGVPIRSESDILRIDSFQVDPSKLAVYYLVCRYQIMGEDRLNDLIANYDGARYYELPDGKSGGPESGSSSQG